MKFIGLLHSETGIIAAVRSALNEPYKCHRCPLEENILNQTTINSLDWLNTIRMYFHTNKSPIQWGVRLSALVNILLVIPF